MGWRFRKSVTLLPGVRVNFGLHSTSLSLGGKGFRTTYSSTGRVTRSVGIPGTGLSYVSSSNSRRNRSSNRNSFGGNQRSAPSIQSIPELANQANFNNPARQPIIKGYEEFAEEIQAIYRFADSPIDWKHILLSENDPSIPNFQYFKDRVDNILNGDIDTYFEVITDVNPLDDLLQYGSKFECGTDDPRLIGIHFEVNSKAVLESAHHLLHAEYNSLLQDYVCGCSIRIARDMFALLPLRYVLVDASNDGIDILSVKFSREETCSQDYSRLDASEFIEKFEHRMDFDDNNGFHAISPIDLK